MGGTAWCPPHRIGLHNATLTPRTARPPRMPSPLVWASVPWSGASLVVDGKKAATMLDQIYGSTNEKKEERYNPSVLSSKSLL